MFPTLFNVGSFPVHTYGVLIALGFLAGTYLTRREAIKYGWNVERVVDFCFSGLFVGFLGSRLFFVLTQFQYYSEHPLEIFAVWEGGMVFYGGPIFVVPWGLWWLRRNKIPVATMTDVAVQGLTLGHAIARWGCLATGCCYGRICDYPWAVRLHSEVVDVHMRGQPLHPTQIYESLLLFALFGFLRFKQSRKRFEGQIAVLYFMLYPLLRSFVEVYRGDVVRGFVIQDLLSTSQFVSLLVFTIASIVYYRLLQNSKSLKR